MPVFDAEGVTEHATELGVIEPGVDDREVALALEDAVAERQVEVPRVVPPVQDSTDRGLGGPGILHDPDRIIGHRQLLCVVRRSAAEHRTYSQGVTLQIARRSRPCAAAAAPRGPA